MLDGKDKVDMAMHILKILAGKRKLPKGTRGLIRIILSAPPKTDQAGATFLAGR